MKIVGRILIILLAGLIVAGVVYGIYQGSASPALGGGASRLLSVPAGAYFIRGVIPDLSHGRYAATINNLGKIGVITVIVIAISLIKDRIKRARRRKSHRANL
jgi:hypothetical protein